MYHQLAVRYGKPEEEPELIRLCQENRDQAAMRKLVECHMSLILKYANGFARRGADIDDLVSEGIMAVMDSVEKFDPSRGTMLSTLARLEIMNRLASFCRHNLKSVKRSSGDVDSEGIIDNVKDDALPQDEKMIADETSVAIASAMRVLDEAESTVIRSRYLSDEKMLLSDIGKLIGVSKMQAWVIEKRALKKLHRELKKKVV